MANIINKTNEIMLLSSMFDLMTILHKLLQIYINQEYRSEFTEIHGQDLYIGS